eukprot:scaffold393830_cov23-Prasinocladus_malaysianus.AAC.1
MPQDMTARNIQDCRFGVQASECCWRCLYGGKEQSRLCIRVPSHAHTQMLLVQYGWYAISIARDK